MKKILAMVLLTQYYCPLRFLPILTLPMTLRPPARFKSSNPVRCLLIRYPQSISPAMRGSIRYLPPMMRLVIPVLMSRLNQAPAPTGTPTPPDNG